MIEKELVIDMRVLIDDIREKVNRGQSVVLKGEGVSMAPFITDADLLTLNKPLFETPKIGEIYLYKRDDGSYAIHRVYAVKNDGVYMLGDAQLFIEKVHKNCLVAIVSSVKRPHETVNCTKPFVRIRSAVCMKRRILKVKSRWAFHSFLGKVGRLLHNIKKLIKKER